jgi:hypothetical protein
MAATKKATVKQKIQFLGTGRRKNQLQEFACFQMAVVKSQLIKEILMITSQWTQ